MTSNDLRKSIIDRINAEMAKKQLSIRKLADEAEISDVQLSRILRGGSGFSFDTLQKIASGLHIPLEELISEPETDFIFITAEPEQRGVIADVASKLPLVLEVHLYTRLVPEIKEVGVLLKILASNVAILKHFVLDQLRAFKGIRDTTSIRIIENYKNDNELKKEQTTEPFIGGLVIFDTDYDRQELLGNELTRLKNAVNVYAGDGHADLMVETTLSTEEALKALVNEISKKNGIKSCTDLFRLETLS